MPLRSITFLLYFLGSSGAAIAFPMIGVVCYIVLYHVYPQTTWWGPYLDFLGIRYAFVCGLCLLIGTGLNLNRLPIGRRILHPTEWAMLAVFLCILLSATMAGQWSYRTDVFLDKMGKVFLFVLLMSHVVVTRNRLWQLTLVLTLMALYLGHEAKIAPPGAFRTSRLDGIGGPDFRESSGLAIHLFALMPFAVVVFQQKRLWLKVLAFLAGCYALNAVLLCRTRSAFMAGMVAGIMAIWYIPRRHRRWLILLLVCATIGGVILSDNWFWERMVTIFSSAEERDQSASMRFTLWAGAWRMIRSNPWGVGVGHFEQRIAEYVDCPEIEMRNAHNSFLLCAAEIGVLGFIAYLAVLATAWHSLSCVNRMARTRLHDPDLFEMLVFANRLAIVVYMVAGLFVSRFYTEGAWWFLALPVCLERAVENEVRVLASEPLPEPALLTQDARLVTARA